MSLSPANETAPQPGEKRALVAVEMGRPCMAVMLVQVFPLPIAFIHRFVLLPDAVRVRLFGIMPVRMQVLMGMRMAVALNPMGMIMLMGMAMGVLVFILAGMFILVFHLRYFSFLICTSSDRYSALSASVV